MMSGLVVMAVVERRECCSSPGRAAVSGHSTVDRMTSSLGADDNLPWLAQVAELADEAHTFDEIVDQLLTAVTDITGLETAFVSEFDWAAGIQRAVASRNVGADLIAPGAEKPLLDSLCIRAFEDEVFWADDAVTRWSDVAHIHGVETYVSVPIRLDDDVDEAHPYGMLCAASTSARIAPEQVRPLFNLLAVVLAGRIASDRERDRARLRAEQAEAFLRERLEFAGMSEHAMKGPLAVIDGWIDTLTERGDLLAPDVREAGLASMKRATTRMLMLLEDLVSEARSALVSTAPASVLLHEVAARVVEDFAAGGEGLTVAGEPTVARADARGVVLVLEHLLENVRSHTPPGTTVVVETRVEDDWAVIEVRDDGPGLPDGIDPFAPFTSGGTSSGLGLHIVRSVMAAMRGTVEAGKADPHGAVFTCRLPRA